MTMEEWAEKLYDFNYKMVAKSIIDVEGTIEVSTVWLGLNHQWLPDRPPLIFETMIFGGPLDRECWRYSTEEQALVGHAEVVRLAELEQQVEQP